MLRIGLTGGIAAGKSVVAGRLGDLGAVLVDADLLAREVVEPGSEGLGEVVDAFGPDVLGADGTLDRPALGRLVFGDDAARARLNAIIHPRVRAASATLIERAPGDSVVVEDIPLLVETGQAARFHKVVVVDAADELRVRRMVEQRGMRREDAEQRIAAQAPRDERLRAADAVLPNERGLEDLLAATDALWHERIEPFAADLRAGRPASAPGSVRTGLDGTGDLDPRVRAKLAAVLPADVVVEGSGAGAASGEAGDGTSGHEDDARRAVLRVQVPGSQDLGTVSAAVAGAGYPRSAREAEASSAAPVHRAADPAYDVVVTLTGGR
ncbi:hypothetical protein AC792_09210 [Arthrobacter sp. RIT-PI-e]|uniref:dephospho-CoA kinase n=1 Tax=Arthrobacter sp. RIT-PI-e TaxID=1681197 RepID=UPI000676A07A|nr:dephospho-CoA kinase [Arthrobacter sp. RIT-PI-e]KNC18887.1 hypothetical protein AC792_09210 [Arthrobacter sp. RIT-PI-e]